MSFPPTGENWEGGYRRRDGVRMVHVPWVGWVEDRRRPFFVPARRPWWRRFVWRRR